MITLSNVATELNMIKTDIINCYTNLSNILINKNVEVLEEDNMNDLIEKVDLLAGKSKYIEFKF